MKSHSQPATSLLLSFLIWGCHARDCDIKYRQILNHSACAPRSRMVKRAPPVSGKDIEEILEYHNSVRSAVSPQACLMFKMYWDQELASVAQAYAETCPNDHEKLSRQRSIPGRFLSGQNLAWGYPGWRSAMRGWADEVKDWNYIMSKRGAVVGHYTQMIWFDSSKIGCGYAVCERKTYVCNYAHPGNVGKMKPYKACANISPLKDCRDKFCYNGGKMDKNCKCKCASVKKFYLKDCLLNCSYSDPKYCGTSFETEDCEHFINVPIKCPNMCKTCPYGDAKRLVSRTPPTSGGSFKHLQCFCILFMLVVKM